MKVLLIDLYILNYGLNVYLRVVTDKLCVYPGLLSQHLKVMTNPVLPIPSINLIYSSNQSIDLIYSSNQSIDQSNIFVKSIHRSI